MPSPRGLLEPFLLERALYVSESTVKQDCFHLNRFLSFLDERNIGEVGAVGFQELDDYCHHLDTVPGQRGGASSAYKKKALQVCRLFLEWACCAGHSLVDFSRYKVPYEVRVKPIEVPSVEQVLKLLEVPSAETPSGQRDRLLLESFYTLALRRRESHRLSLGDINLSKRSIRVMGKKQRERSLPLTKRLTELFASYIRDTRPRLRPLPEETALWISPQTGKRLSFPYLRVVVGTHAKRAGLANIHPHLLRHACATHMLERGADLKSIQLYLGHSSPGSVERYTHVDSEQLKAVFRATHPRARKGPAGKKNG